MRKFKADDLIRCIDVADNAWLTLGKEYVVVRTQFRNEVFIRNDDDEVLEYGQDLFELAQPPSEPKYSHEVIKPFALVDLVQHKLCSNQFVKAVDEVQDVYLVFGEFKDVAKIKTFTDNLDWLIKYGYLKRVKTFKPFTLSLEIKSKDDFATLYHRLNMADEDVIQRISKYNDLDYGYTDTSLKYFRQINEHTKTVKSNL